MYILIMIYISTCSHLQVFELATGIENLELGCVSFVCVNAFHAHVTRYASAKLDIAHLKSTRDRLAGQALVAQKSETLGKQTVSHPLMALFPSANLWQFGRL